MDRTMNRYGRLQALTLSFYSRALYRDVAQNWKGAGLLYLWNVLALSWMACAFTTHSRSDALGGIIDQVPPIRIEHGVAFVDVQQPYVIRDADGGVVAVLDTRETGDPMSPASPIVLTRHAVVFQTEGKTRITPLDQLPDMTIDAEGIHGALALFGMAIIAGTFMYRALLTLAYGSIVRRSAARAGTILSYPAAMRIAAVSITPVIFVNTALSLVGNPMPLWPFWRFALTLTYLRFGALAAAIPEHEPAACPVADRQAA